MEYQLSSTSMAPLVEISLDNNEEIQIESGAMVYHNAAVKLEGKMNSNGKGGLGGALKALGRSITSGESFFITKASAIGANGKISLAPASLGSIKEIRLKLQAKKQPCRFASFPFKMPNFPKTDGAAQIAANSFPSLN